MSHEMSHIYEGRCVSRLKAGKGRAEVLPAAAGGQLYLAGKHKLTGLHNAHEDRNIRKLKTFNKCGNLYLLSLQCCAISIPEFTLYSRLNSAQSVLFPFLLSVLNWWWQAEVGPSSRRLPHRSGIHFKI